jgi:hypothetical protein
LQLHVGWCIIEWDGENTYDTLPCNNVCFLDGEDPKYEIGELVLGVCIGRPYKGRIAIVAGKYMFIHYYGIINTCSLLI